MYLIHSTATFTRPADTTQYTQNDLIADNTTAGSVTPMTFSIPGGRGFKLWRAHLSKTTTTITNATFRLHLFKDSPTVANGDNGAFSTTNSNYQGFIDIAAAGVANTSGYSSSGVFVNNSVFAPMFIITDVDQLVYGLLQMTAATGYIPGSAESFTVTLLGEAYR